MEKVEKYWCTKLNCSRGGLRKNDYDTLSKFGKIQNVKGDGKCGVYSAVEGLLNCLIAVTTNVKDFRKEVRDFIDTNCNEVLMNFTFSFKLLKNGTVRGKKRDDWIENDVMKRMWQEGGKYHPRAKEESWVLANWNNLVLAVMYNVNFVWCDCDNTMTYVAVKYYRNGHTRKEPLRKRDC